MVLLLLIRVMLVSAVCFSLVDIIRDPFGPDVDDFNPDAVLMRTERELFSALANMDSCVIFVFRFQSIPIAQFFSTPLYPVTWNGVVQLKLDCSLFWPGATCRYSSLKREEDQDAEME